MYECVLGGEKCLFFEKLDTLCFIVTTVFEIRNFTLFPTIISFGPNFSQPTTILILLLYFFSSETTLLPAYLHDDLY